MSNTPTITEETIIASSPFECVPLSTSGLVEPDSPEKDGSYVTIQPQARLQSSPQMQSNTEPKTGLEIPHKPRVQSVTFIQPKSQVPQIPSKSVEDDSPPAAGKFFKDRFKS